MQLEPYLPSSPAPAPTTHQISEMSLMDPCLLTRREGSESWVPEGTGDFISPAWSLSGCGVGRQGASSPTSG